MAAESGLRANAITACNEWKSDHFRVTMSVAEIKQAVQGLSPAELAELSSFIADHAAQSWDQQIDADFSEGGRLRPVLEEVRADLRAGRLEPMP